MDKLLNLHILLQDKICDIEQILNLMDCVIHTETSYTKIGRKKERSKKNPIHIEIHELQIVPDKILH